MSLDGRGENALLIKALVLLTYFLHESGLGNFLISKFLHEAQIYAVIIFK
ncbi:protein of unknown function (plasmid) [Rhodovastum atsumiense]|nr:hypothetical protein [Rhodovastum atsumiense]CAH2605899.1 protein of unknown function [Rhodovastum atsumiense]